MWMIWSLDSSCMGRRGRLANGVMFLINVVLGTCPEFPYHQIYDQLVEAMKYSLLIRIMTRREYGVIS